MTTTKRQAEFIQHAERTLLAAHADYVRAGSPAEQYDHLIGKPLAVLAAVVDRPINVDFKQAAQLLHVFGGEPAEMALQYSDGHEGWGLYAWHMDYPEEGAYCLGTPDSDARPSPEVVQEICVALGALAASAGDAARWQPIDTIGKSSDLVWIYDALSDAVKGPMAEWEAESRADSFTHWAPCKPPSAETAQQAGQAAPGGTK